VWVPGEVPPRLAAAVSRLTGVSHVAPVLGGTAWLNRSSDSDGRTVDDPRAGFAVPLEVAAAPPRALAPFLPPPDAHAFATATRHGDVLLGSTGSKLRRVRTGGSLRFGAASTGVGGVIDDRLIGAYEVLAPSTMAGSLGMRTVKYLLVLPRRDTPGPVLATRIRRLAAGSPILVSAANRLPFARDSPNTLPASLEKLAMGEFAARPGPGGTLVIDPAWIASHIVSADVPALGRVACNRAFLPLLRTVLGDLDRRGLGRLVDPSTSSGCFNPRFVTRDPSQLISHHAWGSAADLNIRANLFGSAPRQDPRLVVAFERRGFQWGGRWLIPDGMHFEFGVRQLR
jgi:hypothetical protein